MHDLLPLVAEPNSTCFRHPARTRRKPLGSRAFQPHRANLLTATFDGAAADALALLTKMSIVHAGQIVLKIGCSFRGRVCRIGLVGKC